MIQINYFMKFIHSNIIDTECDLRTVIDVDDIADIQCLETKTNWKRRTDADFVKDEDLRDGI